MSNLLKNRWAVGALVIAACGAVYMNAVRPLLGTTAAVDTPVIPETNAGIPLPGLMNATFSAGEPHGKVGGGKAELAALSWIDRPARDPFQLNPMVSPIQKISPTSMHLPRLTALAAGPSLRFAVVDGLVVKEGEQVNKFTVVRITPQAVHLRGPSGDVKLGLSGPR